MADDLTQAKVIAADTAMVDDHNVEQDRLSTFRRYIFASWTTAANLVITCVVMWKGGETILAQTVINAAYSYMELMAVLLLSASVIDRSRLIDRFLPSRFGGGYGLRDDRDSDNHDQDHK